MRWAPVALLLVAISACSDGDQLGSATQVSDSAGVRVVHNVGPDAPADLQIREIARLIPPDSAMVAVPWAVAADTVTGQVYIADQTTPRLLVFREDGRYLRALGRQGEGPGEWTTPFAVALTRAGEVGVWDVGRNVLSVWSASGAHLSESLPPVPFWGPGFAFEPDGIVTVTATPEGLATEQRLVRASENQVQVLHSIAQTLEHVELPCGTLPMTRLLEPSMVWTHDGEGVRVLSGPAYRIDRYIDGRLASSIRRDVATIPVDDALAAQRAELEYGPFLERCGLSVGSFVTSVGHAEMVSPVRALSVDPSGRLWATRGPDVGASVSLDLIDEDGRYRGTVSAGAEPVAWLSRSRFIGFSVQPQSGETMITIQEVAGPVRPGG